MPVTPINFPREDIYNEVEAFRNQTSKCYYYKNSTNSISTNRQSENVDKDTNDYRLLFSNLGLNYDHDVSPEIKDQLKMNKNAISILQDLGKKI